MITDHGSKVREFRSRAFMASDLKNDRFELTEQWRPEKLWDIHTPQHVHQAAVSLVDEQDQLLDAALPVRFGFRELWINGRDFYLNGTRIYLSSLPLDNAQVSAAAASYEAAKESLTRLKRIGINFVYTHNYGCEPGSHLSFEEILRAADDVGMLVALSQPHFAQYDWQSPRAEEKNGYAHHARFYIRVAGSHPSVVFYSLSHNSTGYDGDMDPDMIDGIHGVRSQWSANNVKRAVLAEAIVARLDPSRIVYHHSSGNLSSMHTMNFYTNMAPAQELDDWFEHWATKGVKPVFTCEYMVPCTWDWTMYRGWYKGVRTFGNATVPWEFCVAEWSSQFLGDRAYRIGEEEKKNLRWEAAQFRAGRLWHRWDYPFQVGSHGFESQHTIIGTYLASNWRASARGASRQFPPGSTTFSGASARESTSAARISRSTGRTSSARIQPGLHRSTVRTHGPGLPTLGLDRNGRRPGNSPQQHAALGLCRRKAGGLDEQGPQLLSGRGGRKADCRHQQFSRDGLCRLPLDARPPRTRSRQCEGNGGNRPAGADSAPFRSAGRGAAWDVSTQRRGELRQWRGAEGRVYDWRDAEASSRTSLCTDRPV